MLIEIMVYVAENESTQRVRSFGSDTVELQASREWLAGHGVETVAMESTSVYWMPLFEELERRVFHCHLTLAPHASAGLSSRSLKRVPGRKSDVVDCQWIQTLHSYGLLESSFRPEADLVALRTLLRHRAQLIQHRSPHILHMQKALLQMNIQLSQTLSDVSGITGQAILRAIVAGERDPHKLAALRNYRCKKDEQEIAKAFTGTWREEHLLILKQSLEFYDFSTSQLEACHAQIEHSYSLVRPDWVQTNLPDLPEKRNFHSKNAAQAIQVRKHLKRIGGVDLTAVHGVSASLAQTIVIEVGTEKAFA